MLDSSICIVGAGIRVSATATSTSCASGPAKNEPPRAVCFGIRESSYWDRIRLIKLQWKRKTNTEWCDTKRIESVQRRFTKRLPGLFHLNYTNRLKSLGLETLELRRLHHDLMYTYKVLFRKTNMDCANMFSVARYTTNRGHPWKLYASYCRTSLRKHYILWTCSSP